MAGALKGKGVQVFLGVMGLASQTETYSKHIAGKQRGLKVDEIFMKAAKASIISLSAADDPAGGEHEERGKISNSDSQEC